VLAALQELKDELKQRRPASSARAPQPPARPAPAAPPRLSADHVARDQYLAMLVDMGFGAEAALRTLIECADNMELAVDRLMGEPAQGRISRAAAPAPRSPPEYRKRVSPKSFPAPVSPQRIVVAPKSVGGSAPVSRMFVRGRAPAISAPRPASLPALVASPATNMARTYSAPAPPVADAAPKLENGL
jgi:hypothetical protein